MECRYECHGHIFMDGADYRLAAARHKNGPDAGEVRAHLAACRANGTAYFRDGGDPYGVSLLARELAPEYGIEYRTPAFAIHREGRYGGIVGPGYGSIAEYRELVREARRQGADFIKVMFSGVLDFNTYGAVSCPPLEAEEIHELVRIAHGEGFAVMAHVNGAGPVRAALEAGTDSIEHGYLMDGSCAELLAESGAVWVPTLAAIEAFAHRPGFDPQVVSRLLAEQYRLLRFAAGKGAVIAIGSDAGAVGVPHGAGACRERELLLNALGPGASDALDQGCRSLAGRFRSPF